MIYPSAIQKISIIQVFFLRILFSIIFSSLFVNSTAHSPQPTAWHSKNIKKFRNSRIKAKNLNIQKWLANLRVCINIWIYTYMYAHVRTYCIDCYMTEYIDLYVYIYMSQDWVWQCKSWDKKRKSIRHCYQQSTDFESLRMHSPNWILFIAQMGMRSKREREGEKSGRERKKQSTHKQE